MISWYELVYRLCPKRYEWCIGFKNKSGFTEYLRLPARKIRGIKEWWEEGGKEVFCRWRVVVIDITENQQLGGINV
jgi:hypothetical protein